jgi:biopolymer transport protein ExbD
MGHYVSVGLTAMVWLTLTSIAAANAEPQLEKGTVVSASAGTLVIKDKAGKQLSFSIDAATKITVNGKPGKLEDLQETMPVQVMTDEKGKVLTVATIDKDKRAKENRYATAIAAMAHPSP